VRCAPPNFLQARRTRCAIKNARAKSLNASSTALREKNGFSISDGPERSSAIDAACGECGPTSSPVSASALGS
jgi:hypothetical protein